MSIKHKISLILSLIFCVFFVAAAALLVHLGEDKIRGSIIAQQAALANTLAYGFDQQVLARQNALVSVAAGLSPELLKNPARLATFVQDRLILRTLFTNILIYGADGTVLAAHPSPERYVGSKRLARMEYVVNTLASRKPYISKLFVSPVSGEPLIVMTAPVLGPNGEVLAIIGGSQYLQRDNLFSGFTEGGIGQTGSKFLLTRDRVIVAHTDTTRVMEKLAPGANLGIEQALKESRFSGEVVSSRGVPILTTLEPMETTGWLAGTIMPLEEAYAPITAMRHRAIQFVAVLMLCLPLMVWLTMGFISRPLVDLRDRIGKMAAAPIATPLMALDRKDEIGELALAFDQLTLARRGTERALQESEARYRSLIEHSPEAIVVISGGKIIYLNPAAESLLGATPGNNLIGRPPLDMVHPDFHAFAQARADKIRREGGSVPMAEMKFIKLDGTTIDVEAQATAVAFDGEPTIYVTWHDISARKKVEAARLSLETQLRESQKMEAIGTLAGGIAHDINNIIATILGNVELARQDAGANRRTLESLDEIRKAGRRASDVVQQILSFSRRQPTEHRAIALPSVIAEAVRLLRATLPARVALDLHCEDETPAVLADATQIQQVIINLVTNAMQAMQGKPGRVQIHVNTVDLNAALADRYPELRALHARRQGPVVRICVADNGPGMDAATQARIFEPFFTTKPAGEGTGLGLAVVHGIVESHHGAIIVNSTPDMGTTFTLYLPVAEKPPAEPPADAVATAPIQTAQAPGDLRILYLDDDESLVFLVNRMLGRRGYRVSGFINPREALDALQADPALFDLIVTDFNMPGLSGLDVAREVRSLRGDLPVVIASGFIDDELRAKAEAIGVREVIFKANAIEDLCDAFARVAQAVCAKTGPA
jgi:PAS domain S-box-containing protein